MGAWIASVVTKVLAGAAKVLAVAAKILAVATLRKYPEIVVLPIPTAILAASIVGTTALIHLLVLRITSPRCARVFISFQHDREAIAERLAESMVDLGLSPSRLPFMDNPDHDSLLEKVRQEISDCDVFVCIPGVHASFVENEVSMAFALQKPMLFISVEGDSARIPNTAKKGHPIFTLERIQHKGLRTLAKFCSYLAADWRSTTRIYRAVFENWLLAIVAFIFVNAIYIFLLTHWPNEMPAASAAYPTIANISDLWEWLKAIVSDPVAFQALVRDPSTIAFVVTSLVLYLLIYGAFAMRRIMLRTKVRRAISGQRFRENTLPRRLDSSLTREDLRRILYHGDIRAEHESETPHPQNA